MNIHLRKFSKGYNLSFNVDVSTKKAKKQIRKLIDSVTR